MDLQLAGIPGSVRDVAVAALTRALPTNSAPRA